MSDKAEEAKPQEEVAKDAPEASEAPAKEEEAPERELTLEELMEENKELKAELKALKETVQKEHGNFQNAEKERNQLKRVVQHLMKMSKTSESPENGNEEEAAQASRGRRKRGGRGRNRNRFEDGDANRGKPAVTTPVRKQQPSGQADAPSKADAEAREVRESLRKSADAESLKTTINRAKELNLQHEVALGERKLQKLEGQASA